MEKKKKTLKDLLLEIIAGLAIGFAIVFIYGYLFTPDIIKAFNKYDGIIFDYKVEEENYKENLHYKQLSESEARHYRAMYHAAINDEDFYYLESMDLFDEDETRRALDAFGSDYPEYYWFGYSTIANTTIIKDKLNFLDLSYVTVTADCYDFETEDILTNKEIINNKLNDIIPSLKGENDYDTLKNVYDYVVNNTKYDINTYEMSDIRASLINQKAVCSSYSETFQLICNQLGYECYSVVGYFLDLYDSANDTYIDSSQYVINEEEDLHEWNIIKVNNNWYWVDTTWGEVEYYDLNDKLIESVDYSYFLVPDKIFFIDHACDDQFEYPSCTDETYCTQDYNRIIINEYNEDDITSCLINAFKDKKRDNLFYFTSETDLRSMIDLLETDKFFDIYERNINKYYNGVYNYYYSSNYSLYLYWRF